MGRLPVVHNHPKSLGGTSTSEYSLQRRDRDSKLKPWVHDIERALARARSRRMIIKRAEEKQKISEDRAAGRYRSSQLKLVEEARAILDRVPQADRDSKWIDKDAWEKEERSVVSMEDNDNINDFPTAEDNDTARKKRKLLMVELGSSVKRTRVVEDEKFEGYGDECKSEWSGESDWGSSEESELEGIIGEDTDDEEKTEKAGEILEEIRAALAVAHRKAIPHERIAKVAATERLKLTSVGEGEMGGDGKEVEGEEDVEGEENMESGEDDASEYESE